MAMTWVFIITLGLGVALILLGLFLLVFWRIPQLVDELSGRKARRQIKKMHEINKATSGGSVINTEDFYSAMNSTSKSTDDYISTSAFMDSLNIPDQVADVEEPPEVEDEDSLAAKIQDPYGRVWGQNIGPQKSGYKRSNIQDGVATEMFADSEDEPVAQSTVRHKITIKEEQSSLFN